MFVDERFINKAQFDAGFEARLFSGENRKAVSFFYKYDKTTDFLET